MKTTSLITIITLFILSTPATFAQDLYDEDYPGEVTLAMETEESLDFAEDFQEECCKDGVLAIESGCLNVTCPVGKIEEPAKIQMGAPAPLPSVQ